MTTHKRSWQRPVQSTQEHFDSEFERIFNKSKSDGVTGEDIAKAKELLDSKEVPTEERTIK